MLFAHRYERDGRIWGLSRVTRGGSLRMIGRRPALRRLYQLRNQPTPKRSQKLGDWISDIYLPTLSEEITHALDQLHNATNWGLTLVTAGLLAVIARDGFPDDISVYGLSVLLVLCGHFSVRGMKGYINVIRFSLIQKLALSYRLAAKGAGPELLALEHAIRAYHVSWYLPITRRTVYWKGSTELGFGYILVLLVGLLGFSVLSVPTRPWPPV